MKLSDYLQRFRVRLYDAFQKLRDTDVAYIHLLSSWNVHCKLMFYGLMNEFKSNGDVIKFLVDFAVDLSNSHLFKVILDEDAEVDFQKFEVLVAIEYLVNKCSSISSVFNAISSSYQ